MMNKYKIKPFISVIIPCYNEEQNLKNGVLEEVYRYLVKQNHTWEVIIVNDGSTDKSKSIIKNFIKNKNNFRFYDILHGGKPAAIWAGIRRADGEIVLFTDMDQSTSIDELGKLLTWYDRRYDVVIGSRGMTRKGFSIIRKCGSYIFRTMRRLVILHNINDTQCGFKSCRRRSALEIFPRLQYFKQKNRPSGWKVSAFDVELLFLFEKAGYSIKEVEVNWQNRDQSDTKNQTGKIRKYIMESIEMADEVLRVKLNQHKGLYKK